MDRSVVVVVSYSKQFLHGKTPVSHTCYDTPFMFFIWDKCFASSPAFSLHERSMSTVFEIKKKAFSKSTLSLINYINPKP